MLSTMCQVKAPQIPQKRRNAKAEHDNKGSVQWIAVECGIKKKKSQLISTINSIHSIYSFNFTFLETVAAHLVETLLSRRYIFVPSNHKPDN